MIIVSSNQLVDLLKLLKVAASNVWPLHSVGDEIGEVIGKRKLAVWKLLPQDPFINKGIHW